MPQTRSSAGGDQSAHNTKNGNPPSPPPQMTMEQLVAMQTQLMQGMAHMMIVMNQNQTQNQGRNQALG